MTVSVIIPVLNEASVIEKTLRHTKALHGDFEIIVVDGGSSDATASIAGSLTTLINSSRGRWTQMNTGAKSASGEILLFLHADTLLPIGAFTAIEHSLSNLKVIGGRFNLRLDENGWKYRLVGSSINLRDRLIKGFTGDQAIFIRKSAFEHLGGYRALPLMEDLDLGVRMCRSGKVVRLPLTVITSARRWKNNGVVKTVILMWALRLSYFLGIPHRRLRQRYGDTR